MDYDKVLITVGKFTELYNQLVYLGVSSDKIIIDGDQGRDVYGYRSYSQHNEDLIIAAFLSQIGVKKPTYLDLGAYHPTRLSNTAFLYMNGCRGVNVDADPKSISEFNKMRPEDVNVDLGAGVIPGELDYYIFENGEYSTFLKELSNLRIKEGYALEQVKKIKIAALTDIVQEYCLGVFPDLLDCDLEGYDYDILNSYDFSLSHPKVICVETDDGGESQFSNMLSGKGYFLYSKIFCNSIYVSKEYRGCLGY